jgi:HK97 family phage major capsid protein
MTDYDFLNASLNNDEGGYLVPVGYANKIINNINQADQSLSLVRSWPMSTLVENVPLLSTAAAAAYTSAEGQNKGNTQPAFGQMTLTCKELAAVVVVTERLLMATNIDGLIGVIQEDLVKAFAKAKVQTLFGYANDGTFTNDLTDDAVSTVAYGTGDDLLADCSALLGDLEALGYFENLAWVTHPAVRQKFRDLRDDN